jgi:hypothetical protein
VKIAKQEGAAHAVTSTYGVLDMGQSQAETVEAVARLQEGMNLYDRAMRQDNQKFNEMTAFKLMEAILQGQPLRVNDN